jgi:hypothetical protein
VNKVDEIRATFISSRKQFIGGCVLSLAISACAGIVEVTPPQPALNDPYAEPAEPLDPPEEGAESMNTEYFLGSAKQEAEMFQRFSKEIQDIQRKQAKDQNQPVQRGFHAKHHGCLHGSLRLHEDRDRNTRFGIFAGPRTEFPVWVRLSNGVGWKQADDKQDARGMAIKVMEVEGEKYLNEETLTQDFLLTNSPVPIGKNAVHFMRFAHANSRGFWSAIWFGITHPASGLPGVRRTGTVDDMVAEQYWSGGAFHLGSHQAVKITAKACKEPFEREYDDDDPNYLGKALTRRAKDGLCFRLYAQFQVNPTDTPIEYAAHVWEEDVSPLVPIADIILPGQDIHEEGRSELCRQLSYNPWHSLAAHKPMGHVNRARRFVYGASAAFRKRGPEPVPYGPKTPAEPTKTPETAVPVEPKDAQEAATAPESTEPKESAAPTGPAPAPSDGLESPVEPPPATAPTSP